MIYRIVLFRVKEEKCCNELWFRGYFTQIRRINHKYHCEDITILKCISAGGYAYISVWKNEDILAYMRKAPEYIAFVERLLIHVDIESDTVYCEE